MTGASGTRRLVYDGLNVVGEYNNDNLVNDYYVHGNGPDEPLVWYNYQGGSGRQFFHADERGSVIATSDATGNRLTLDTYDEYGKPGSTNSGAFQYTGQMWLPEAGVYHYKSRAYLPHLGIFGQTDPAGYAAGPNLYAYALDDPVNFVGSVGPPSCM